MKKGLLVSCVFFCLVACSDEQGKDQQSQSKIKPTNVSTNGSLQYESLTENAVAKRAKQQILEYKEINEVIAIHHDMQLFVGFNVKKFQEFKVKKIEDKVKRDLEKSNPNEIIVVSHDLKILMELKKLKNEESSLTEEAIKMRLQKIKELSLEKT
ncbi:YhcN/YlaJ family sporulation lipoprotein [Bacillus sp. DJP31]|uniref:YhcN/YlaJ family sporulation lipoprotein n=1 Tax=Bacillus sp. DJP31 TaxID=3409789 RepID=UPI003BB4A06A